MPLPLFDESSHPKNKEDDLKKRRSVLRDTVEKLSTPEKRANYIEIAQKNHAGWKESGSIEQTKTVRVLEGDWGMVTQQLSKETGAVYAVLNMSNPILPGGAYRHGSPAQEENMFRRTDCHFSITDDMVTGDGYTTTMTQLINAEHGEVYFDSTPRVCIKGQEDKAAPDLGYADLAESDCFLFYEMRSAADNLNSRQSKSFDPQSMRRKIAAQLDTLIQNKVRHVVLSAFGCGVFGNPPEKVAQIYKEQIQQRAEHFDDITFAIFHAGYGPDNFTPFRDKLHDLPLKQYSTVDLKRQRVIDELQGYILTIQKISQTPDGFQTGFNLFAKSRGINREINFEIAKQLLQKLNSNESMESVFKQETIEAIRKPLMKKNPTYYGFDFGIVGRLSRIIDEARKPDEAEPAPGCFSSYQNKK